MWGSPHEHAVRLQDSERSRPLPSPVASDSAFPGSEGSSYPSEGGSRATSTRVLLEHLNTQALGNNPGE